MPNTGNGGLLGVLVGNIINGVIYGAGLMLVLWVLRSSDIVEWNIVWYKAVIVTSVVNLLRFYDRLIRQSL